MPEVELTAGTIEYEDTGGDGPVLVLLGGLVMPGAVWDPVTSDLRADHRCIVPTLPLGGHRIPMKPDAELTLESFGVMVGEFLEALDLDDVVIVQNDHAAGLAYAATGGERIAKLVISSCESFENYPPGLPGKNIRLTAYAPGGMFLAMQAMRLKPLRHSPIGFGWLAKRPLPDELWDEWLEPAQNDSGVRRDLRKYSAGSRRQQMLDVCEGLRGFDRPTLVVWTPEDRIQKPDHGRRFAELIPGSRLVEIEDSYTLIMRDQPEIFAREIREFVAA